MIPTMFSLFIPEIIDGVRTSATTTVSGGASLRFISSMLSKIANNEFFISRTSVAR